MKIVSGGIQHETNTFATVPTTLADFQRDSGCGPEFSGGEFLTRLYRGTGTIQGGYLAGAEELGCDYAPVFCAHAQPAGIVQQSAFEHMLSRLTGRIREQLPADGILLDLHGAMVTDNHDDAESVIIQAVRKVVGPKVPVVVTLDLHANISAEMARVADVIIGFDTYPHVDMYDRGLEAARLLGRIIRGEVHPVQVFRQLPLITLPPMQCTLREPMKSFMERVHQLESRSGVLTATYAMGFPFADIRDAGVTVLVTTDGDWELADRCADELAKDLWSMRDELLPQLMPVSELIRFCREEAQGLVVYADGSDNPGGGAPCDGTVILRALIEAQFEGAVVGILHDPETAAQAHQAGVGKTIRVRLGGKTDNLHGAPIEGEAYIRALCDGHFTYHGPMRQGLPGDFGPMALLVIGGVEVVVGSRRQQLLDSEMIRICGVTPEHRKLLVVKSAAHFRAEIGPLAKHIFDADTPGIHRPDFANYRYEKLRRPIAPLDPGVCFRQ